MAAQVRTALEVSFSLLLISLLGGCLNGGDTAEGGGGTTLPVTTGLLQSLSITPAGVSTASACAPLQYVATAHYSDATSKDVTAEVSWAIDPAGSSVAIVNAASGVVVGIAPGSAVVSAWAGSFAASAVVTISSATLNSLAVTPASATIAATATQAYSAIATCSNGTLDVSAMNIWASGNTSVATVSSAGVAQGVAAGSAVITATAGTVAASAVLAVQ